MRIAITGHKGQLGQALIETLTDDEILGLDIPEHDITQAQADLGHDRRIQARRRDPHRRPDGRRSLRPRARTGPADQRPGHAQRRPGLPALRRGARGREHQRSI